MACMKRNPQRARLAREVQWCQQYAAMNRIGLQRLAEQYDRCCPRGDGGRFLQALSLAFHSNACFRHGVDIVCSMDEKRIAVRAGQEKWQPACQHCPRPG